MKNIFFLLCSCALVAQNVSKSIILLPDTGQKTSYTNTFGEDNDYVINTPSYTDNGDGTITDNVTGLIWQKADGGEMTIENAITYCDNLVLGGNSDWRLPTPMESFSILNLQNANPALNTTYFTNTVAEYWWTSSFQVGDNSKVWCTNAGGGIGNHPKSETISAGGTKKFHVKAVRNGNTNTVISHFTDNGDGTITDNLTQLVWLKAPATNAMTWEQALSYAEALTTSSSSDWRLPNIKELQSLNDETKSNPSVNQTFFPNLGIKNYWSSTTLKPNATNPSSAWYWNTQFGITTYDVKANNNYVLCVSGTPQNLSINESIKQSNLLVFPNPFIATIHIENKNGNENYDLYNSFGTLLFSGTNVQEQDFSYLSAGIYFLKVKSDGISNFKLIKQ